LPGNPGPPGESKFNPQILAELFDPVTESEAAKEAAGTDESPLTSTTQQPVVDAMRTEMLENLESSYDDLQFDAPIPVIQSRNLYEKVVDFHYKLQMMLAPNGTKQFPAKTCNDLFLNYPEKNSGDF
jgi:hypothetical protein